MFALALIAAATLTACTSPPEPPAGPSPTPSAATAGPVSGINQTPRDKLVTGGHLTLGLTDWPTDWNPWSTDLATHIDSVLAAIRPRLFDVTSAGALQPNPDWLDGPPDVETAAATQVTYHLNPAAVWGDGQAVSVSDFQATWYACADPASGRPCTSGRGFDQIASVEPGPGPADIVVTYIGPYPDWAFTFLDGPLRAESSTGGGADPWVDPSAHRDAQAGPYTVIAAHPNSDTIVLVPNPYWWGQPAQLNSITLRRVAAEGLAASLAAHQFDAWPLGLDPAAYTAAALTSTLQLRRSPSASWRVLLLNANTPALADRRVRQAIASAVDRPTLALADLPGLSWTPETLNSLAWQPGQAAYADLAKTTALPYDAESAPTLFAEAGWDLEGAVRQHDGVPLTLRYGVVAGDPLSESGGLQIRAQLAAVGVAVTLVPVVSLDSSSLTDQGLDLVTVTWHNDLCPAQRLASAFMTGGSANLSGYDNPTADSVLAAAVTASNAEARVNLLTAADMTLWRDAVALPLYIVPDTWATAPNVANLGPSGLATLRWEDVGFTS